MSDPDNTPIINLVERQIQQFVEAMRPDPGIRPKLDIGYTYERNTLTLMEIRPRWDAPSEKLELPFARARYVQKYGVWKLYWARASGKWESYEPQAEVKQLAEFFQVVREDAYGCFFG